jgi:hypothetical protein
MSRIFCDCGAWPACRRNHRKIRRAAGIGTWFSGRRSSQNEGWSQLSESVYFSVLAFHSVSPPNEEVAIKNRTAFTRENMP